MGRIPALLMSARTGTHARCPLRTARRMATAFQAVSHATTPAISAFRPVPTAQAYQNAHGALPSGRWI